VLWAYIFRRNPFIECPVQNATKRTAARPFNALFKQTVSATDSPAKSQNPLPERVKISVQFDLTAPILNIMTNSGVELLF
jgi:hypothetical protein